MIPIMSMEPHTHSHTHRHNAHNPSITISSFEVSGNHKTQLALFENEFAQSCKAKKFHELEGELSVALQRMREMDLFSSVDTQVRVLTPEKERASGSGDTKIAVLVVVKEKNMPSLKVRHHHSIVVVVSPLYGSYATTLSLLHTSPLIKHC